MGFLLTALVEHGDAETLVCLRGHRGYPGQLLKALGRRLDLSKSELHFRHPQASPGIARLCQQEPLQQQLGVTMAALLNRLFGKTEDFW